MEELLATVQTLLLHLQIALLGQGGEPPEAAEMVW